MKNIDLNRSEVEERSKKNAEDLSVSGGRFTEMTRESSRPLGRVIQRTKTIKIFLFFIVFIEK